MKTVAFVCARGGSVGLPNKNIRPLLGKPLIAYTVEQALASKHIDTVYVSTDDLTIATVAKDYGAQVPFIRPHQLATSSVSKLDAIQHMCDWLVANGHLFDQIVDLDPTSPLRSVDDIEACINMLDDTTDAVITTFESDKNPYFNMVEYKNDGSISLVCQPVGSVVARQQAPRVYSMNASIYVWHTHTISKGLWNARLRMYVMPRERSIDIDTKLDFDIVQMLMQQRGLQP